MKINPLRVLVDLPGLGPMSLEQFIHMFMDDSEAENIEGIINSIPDLKDKYSLAASLSGHSSAIIIQMLKSGLKHYDAIEVLAEDMLIPSIELASAFPTLLSVLHSSGYLTIHS
jgi:hypothetical protein